MNHSLLANFLDLLDVMVKNPGGPKHPGSPPPGVGSLREEKIEDIQLLFFHMHHLINEFRPHQVWMELRGWAAPFSGNSSRLILSLTR